jgi:hypothetical protein
MPATPRPGRRKQLKAGNLSKDERERIDRKADNKLDK